MKRLYILRNLIVLSAMHFCFAGCQGYESSIPDRPVYLKRNIFTENLNIPGK